MNYYIADTHFGHKNILKFDNRPFFTVEEMDETLINNWNLRVSPADTVYILGDFSWYNEEKTLEILGKLNGKKVLIKGNHDVITAAISECFIGIYDYLEINDNHRKVVLSHYPILFWNNQFRDSYHFYGHVHNSHQWHICEHWKNELKQLQDLPMHMFNVGCMMEYMDFTPRTLKEIFKTGEKYFKKLEKINAEKTSEE